MDIIFCQCPSEANHLIKKMYSSLTLSGSLREDTSVMNPVFRVEASNLSNYNYCYIPSFSRYYFIVDTHVLRTNLWEVSLHVDVLMSFANSIRTSMAIIEESSSAGASNYLPNNVWVPTVKDKTDIINFPNGLLEQGEYILITAGGIAT